ncbi:dTDP-4-dehydrorhamnose reductase family protein [Paenibacillus sp. CMAA1364]
MRILILGGNGMAGHMLVQYFQRQGRHHVFYTTRDSMDNNGLMIDLSDNHLLQHLIQMLRPHVIINAVGILNEYAEKDPVQAYDMNGIFPHRLRELADQYEARLIHISTDCVFLGTKGRYTEMEPPDGVSVYARSKALGEIHSERHLTIRTSIIGPEVRRNGIGLYNWYMLQQGAILGYCNVMWNGVTTLELAKAIDVFIEKNISGLIHLAQSQPIRKYDLLQRFRTHWNPSVVQIVPNSDMVQDRTLLCTRTDLEYEPASYDLMLKELAYWIKMT